MAKMAKDLEGRRKLTAREKQICILIADGLRSREIAQKLGISVKTVETHRANIKNKLAMSTQAELIKYAIRNKWVKV